MLGKVAYHYEYMDSWERINETSLSIKEDITDSDYQHENWVWKDFGTQKLNQAHDLCVQSYTLLLPNVL